MTPEFPFWPATLQALALVVGTRLGLQHNIFIKLTCVCRLLSKNIFHNIGYLVNYLIRYKKFLTSNMFEYTYNRLPY